MAKETDRFIIIHNEGSQLRNGGHRQILVDKETGVTYLCWSQGYGAGITPLLNRDGTPIITKI